MGWKVKNTPHAMKKLRGETKRPTTATHSDKEVTLLSMYGIWEGNADMVNIEDVIKDGRKEIGTRAIELFDE